MHNTILATVVVADDDANVRDALAGLLDDHPCLQVVGLAGTGRMAAELCGLHQPSLAVVDVMMPDGGEFAIRAILEVSPFTIVSMFTARSDRLTRDRMLAAGAAASFTKGGASDLANELAGLWASWRGPGSDAADCGEAPADRKRPRSPVGWGSVD